MIYNIYVYNKQTTWHSSTFEPGNRTSKVVGILLAKIKGCIHMAFSRFWNHKGKGIEAREREA